MVVKNFHALLTAIGPDQWQWSATWPELTRPDPAQNYCWPVDLDRGVWQQRIYSLWWWAVGMKNNSLGYVELRITKCSLNRKAYRTRPHRRHVSASEGLVASVANKQIYLFWLSESFQIHFKDVDWSRRHCFIVKIVPIIDNSLWEKLMSQVSRRSLFHKLQWVTSCCSIAVEFKERVKWDWRYSVNDLIDFD